MVWARAEAVRAEGKPITMETAAQDAMVAGVNKNIVK
jgi:hypothetical protein